MEQNETEMKTPSDKEKKIKRVEKSVISVLLALIIAAVAFVAGWFGRWGALGENKQSLLWAIDTAEKNYYEDIGDELYHNLFGSFGLDPYSTYYSREEYAVIAAEREGQNRDAGVSVWQESYLEAYAAEGSSAASAGIESGMRFLKFGKEEDDLKTGDAEDYFAFVASLGKGDEYFVRCGESEAEAVNYKVGNGENGAGIALMRKFDPMRVYQVVGNSPADHAGLKRGMYILKYGATDNADEMFSGSSDEMIAFVKTLEPDKDGKVTIYLQCASDKEGSDAEVYAVSMEEYQATYCFYRDNKVSYRFRSEKKDEAPEAIETGEPLAALDDQTAYISLTEFTGNAAKEFEKCLDIMKENNRKNLILDLRGNGGGYMDVFVEIASYLLKDATATGGQKVAYAKFKDGATVSYSANRSSYSTYFKDDSRVSILADEHTASASECLIGALVDYNTVNFSDIYLHEDGNGDAHTYGKGIMQTHYADSYGNTLKITSAKIFWPKSNKTIHGVGVNPEDGAVAIASPLLPDASDSFLTEAIGKIQSKGNAPAVNV